MTRTSEAGVSGPGRPGAGATRAATVRLAAIGWEHERCMGPMRAAAAAWTRCRPGVTIDWSARPLAAFNDEPVEGLAARYDLAVVDHPFVGAAHATGSFAALDELLPEETLAALARDAVGRSHESYRYAGHQWALAVDAACQVSVVRDDLLGRSGCRAPERWDEVVDLARSAPGCVALPLYPTDAFCSLLSLCANAGGPAPAGNSFFASEAAGQRVLELLGTLVPHLHPESFALNPPGTLDRMRDSDEIMYVPLVFGYTNYSRGQAEGRLRFLDIPSAGAGSVGSLLGGAGIAVSSASRYPEEVAAFAAWVCSAGAQTGLVFAAGGQPASRTAWLDPTLDEAAGSFFSGTLATIEAAQVRPRARWWPQFQQDAGELLAGLLRGRAEPARLARELEGLYRRHRHEGAHADDPW